MKIYLDTNKDALSWEAEYSVIGEGNAHIVQISSLSVFDVVVARVTVDWGKEFGVEPYPRYCIAVPAFHAVADGYADLLQTGHITSTLVECGMPEVDALTVAQVLRDAAHLLKE